MKFGEKVRDLRREKKLSQTELGDAVGVTLRTVRGWELEGRYPKKRDIYYKLADALDCNATWLMTEEDSYVDDTSDRYGSKGVKQAQEILEQAAALFAGGDLSEEDEIEFVNEIQALYLDSKKRARKFAPKKYR